MNSGLSASAIIPIIGARVTSAKCGAMSADDAAAESNRGESGSRNLHGDFRGATRAFDADDVRERGDPFIQQSDGLLVKVLSQGNGNNHAEIRDRPTGNNVTVMDSLSDEGLQKRLDGGRWG